MIAALKQVCRHVEDKDRLYRTRISEPGDFVFDERVVQVFPDMINRSVPGYGTVVPMIGMLARRYARAGSQLYDLGCSLGAVSLAMRAAVRTHASRIVALDNSPEMIRQLQDILSREPATANAVPIEPVLGDVLDCRFDNTSVTALNFTLQFIEPQYRKLLLQRIAEATVTGGVLLLSEKIRFDDPLEQKLQTEWHHDFKRAQGYSEMEIAGKRDALENVMRPESIEVHIARLQAAGFSRVYRWFQGFNFVSLAAFK